jgi:pimeloyl-ACP methyl ester carboxylesterase
MKHWLIRRLAVALFTLALAACVHRPDLEQRPPIVFVHGNGDSADVWLPTIWRFESNGWPRDRLFAFDIAYPQARDLDDKPQEGRTSAAENTAALAREVDLVLHQTGAGRVVLYGNSRGGIAIRDYVLSPGGRDRVSAAILGGTPNHGVFVDREHRLTSEFNGAGPALTRLNEQNGHGGDEVTPGVRWMTIRSDNNDKYAQPDGQWIGAKGTPTGVDSDGPALRGAQNVLLPGVDHRETAFSPAAFAAAFSFITGRPPATLATTAESEVVIDGVASGSGLNNGGGDAPSNLPLSGAHVEVYETDPESGLRRGAALREVTVGTDGHWGPLKVSPRGRYEFVVTMPGYAVTHIYRGGFLRSASHVNLRAERLADADRAALAVVSLTRPRGYFGLPRNSISFDGKSPPDGLVPGVAGVSRLKVRIDDTVGRAVVAEFDGERVVGRAWPARENHVVLLELLN